MPWVSTFCFYCQSCSMASGKEVLVTTNYILYSSGSDNCLVLGALCERADLAGLIFIQSYVAAGENQRVGLPTQKHALLYFAA